MLAAKILWRAFGTVLVLGMLVSGTFNVLGLLAHGERVDESSFPAADVTALDVSNGTGSVRIVGTDDDQVTMRVEIGEGLRSTGVSEEIVDGVLHLRGTCPNYGSDWCHVRYRIEIPRDRPVTVDTDDGSIEITGMTATVDVHGDNGSIEASDLSGPFIASSDNGRIEGLSLASTQVDARTDNGRVTLQFDVAPTTVTGRSDNGSVEVVVPDTGEAYRLNITTRNGDRRDDLRVDPDSDRSITIATDNGDVTARAG